MRKVDIAAGAVFVLVGAFMLYQSLQLSFYEEGVPGPGFFPALLSIALGLTGAILIVTRLARPDDAFPKFEKPGRTQLQRVMGLWVAVLVAVFLSQIVGFLPAMLLLVATVMLGIEKRRGIGSVAVIILTPLLAYWLFGVLLQVSLPTGLLFGE